MTEETVPVDDLEDGEIESDDEDTAMLQPEVKCEDEDHVKEEVKPVNQEVFYSKPGKKKKSKSKGDQKLKSKDKNKKSRKYTNPTEDDFAGNIEKAIRKAMNKLEGVENYSGEENEERRKHKKRKKHDSRDGPGKKRKKQEYSEEMDESEMMCIRGASPMQKHDEMYPDDDKESYASDSSNDSRGMQQNRPQRQRQQQRDRNKNGNKNDRRRTGGAHPMQDPDGVCLYFMQGKCHKGDECMFSHDALPPRKMELCKFYLMNCCAKRDKCLYMHADFPCKYYHTGLPCIFKDECKFAHGEPLTDNLKNILLKHIESAPKEILGDFPRLNREGAMKMIKQTQANLVIQYGWNVESQEKAIPSLFELNIPNPQDSAQFNQFNNDKQNKISPKVRQSRWQNDGINISNQNFCVSPNTNTGSTDVLNIKNLSGVLTPRQISDLTKMGIDNLDQLGQLTVMQLNSIGISLKQITDIQLNTMSIQKLGLINEQPIPMTAVSKDLDLRVPPVVAFSTANTSSISSDLLGKDVDMRFQSPVVATRAEESIANVKRETPKDSIDIDQYTKDAMKFATKDKENIDISNETFDNDKSVITNEIKDVDHRVLPFQEDARKSFPEETFINKETDTDIRFLQPESVFKRSPGKRHRRSTTTDDEDNHLLIDEKCYSSDEEKFTKRKSSSSSPQPASISPPAPQVIEPSSVINKLGDISKILITDEVTKILNSMKNNLLDYKSENSTDAQESPKLRDPRSKRSPEKQLEIMKPVTKKPARISIYECIDGEPTDGRRRSDVDLRKNDFPSFGDTDLRPGSSGDIDLRLGLPFKAIPNYTPASEIDGSINSHPPILYKVVPIYIPRPDYTDIRNSTAKSQALVDPRLRKVFRLSIEESGGSDSEKPSKPATPPGPRIDPRRKQKESNESEQKGNSLDIQTILQNSNWFKDLSSTQKIFVNQNLMPVTQMLKQFHQDKTPGRVLDITAIQNNPVICGIMSNLGVALEDNGEYSYLPKPKEALLKTPPTNFNQPGNPFAMNVNLANPAIMDPNNMNMMNIGPMGMGGMGSMGTGHNIHGFNQPIPGGGPAPGLLGIAPNIPHNFTGNYGGPNNFPNMNFNGPNSGNDYNNYMDGEPNYTRFPNRGGNHRGRGNDRWNRGGSGRGQRDRKKFNDRGNWKGDRH